MHASPAIAKLCDPGSRLFLVAAHCPVDSTFNRVTELAFDRCVHGFRGNTLTEKEKKCVQVVAAKVLRFSDRMNARFSEAQVRMSELAAAAKP